MNNFKDIVSQVLAFTTGKNLQTKHTQTVIKDLIERENLNLPKVIVSLRSEWNRQLYNFELSFVEANYTETLLKIWLKESLAEAFQYLKTRFESNKDEISALLNNLHCSVIDVSTLGPESLIRPWCKKDRRLNLIKEQSNLFEQANNKYLLLSYLNQFKTSCIDKIYHLCLDNESETQLVLISALKELLIFINLHTELWTEQDSNSKRSSLRKAFSGPTSKSEKLLNILKDIENEKIDGRRLVELLLNHFSTVASNKSIATNEQFLQLLKRFKKSIKSLTKAQLWTPKFQLLTKDICKRFLLPLTPTYEEFTEGGRRVLSVTSTTIRISDIKSQLKERLENPEMKQKKVEEIQIVGLAAVHIDSDMEKEVFHGINVVVLTDKLIVDCPVKWDLSGLDGNPNPKPAKENKDDGQIDGLAGEHGLPGESGGNVHVSYNQTFNAGNWTIVSNGGRGQGGQNGQDGKDGKNGKDATSRQPSKEQFQEIFSSLIDNKKFNGKRFIEKIHNDIEEKLNKYFELIQLSKSKTSTGSNFYFHTFRPDHGVTIKAARMQKSSLILWKGEKGEWPMGGHGGMGGKGGQGGFGGTIIVDKLKHDEGQLNPTTIQVVHQQTQTTNNVTIISVRGKPGEDGRNGRGGESGQRGKSIGDVGYIDNLNDNCENWKTGPNYFGFGKESNFEIRDITNDELSVCQQPYTKCKFDFEPLSDELYALYSIEDTLSLNITQTVNTTKGRQQNAIPEAFKKKAITFQSLVHHLNRIIDRYRSVLRLDLMVTNQLPMNIGDIVRQVMKKHRTVGDGLLNLNNIENTQILHQKSMESRRVLDDIQSRNSSEKFLIDYTYSQLDIDKDIKVMESLDKQVHSSDYRAKYLEDCLQQVSDYLEPQPTKDDGSSILHAVYGQMKNGVYMCDNVNELRQEIHSRVLSSSTSSKEIIKNFILLDSSRQEIKQSYINQVTSFWKNIRDKQEELIVEINKLGNKNILQKMGFNLEGEGEKVINLMLRRCLDAQDISDIDSKINKMTRTKLNGSKSETLKDLVIQLNKEFDWSNQNWKDEYSQAILSKQLTLVELCAIKNDNINLIVSYDDVGRRAGIDIDGDINDSETMTFKCVKRTLQLPTETKFILINRDNQGVWQRLECHPKIRKYLDERIGQIKKRFAFYYGVTKSVYKDGKALSTRRPVTSPTKDELEAHQGLLEWLKVNTTECNSTIMKQITMSIQIFNPEYGCTPGELSRLLLNHFKVFSEKHPLNEILEIGSFTIHKVAVKRLAEDVGWLAERVVDYDSRNIDPIFYLSIVAYLNPHSWKYEFVLLEVEERIREVLDLKERIKWRRNLYILGDSILSVFQQRLHAAGKPGSLNLDKQKLKRILKLLGKHQGDLTKNDVDRLRQLSLNDWLYELKSKMWQKILDDLSKGEETKIEEKKEAIYTLLELENKKGEKFIHSSIIEQVKGKKWGEIFQELKNHWNNINEYPLETLTRLAKEVQDRKLETVIEMIKEESGGNTSESVARMLQHATLKDSLEAIENKLQNKESNDQVLNLKPTLNTSDDINNWFKDPQVSSVGENSEINDVKKFLYCYIRAVQLKMGILLRETQKIVIMTLLLNENNTLAQVATGEGKSLIVAGLAIFHALRGKKVDIITSNNVLAIRDSNEFVIDGGLKDLYNIFNVNVAHNCSENEEDRIKAYNSAVVYGELSNFQRDYLLDTFYVKNIRGDRTFDCVIVDEVDCMLLDRGNNMLYLSHEIPGMELLESLYVFIWEKIRTTEDSLDAIKSAILYDLYGEIKKEDLTSILGPSMEQEGDSAETLWVRLVEQDIINEQGRLLIEDLKKLAKKFSYTELNQKIVFFFCKVFRRKRNIYIPQHLLPFVDRHLDTFLDNAVKALQLNSDEDYVVDREQKGSEFNPQVIIIDRNTGTDQTMSQWDEGLHQFLQLKERCRLTLQSLKSVFISNVTYIKRYDKLYGMTGTLGSQPEREFLKEMYASDYFTVPTARPKQFDFRPAKVVKTQNEWLREIINETMEKAVNEKRSLVIFCRTIKDVNLIHQNLMEEFNEQTVQIQIYTRDYQEFAFGGDKEMGIGQVIVATNLAGRGTDIKISDDLRKHGGLHICLTYLPENIRVEEQAFGRASRKGDPGSGRLILYEPDDIGRMDEEWDKGKIFDIKEERNRQEKQRISRLSGEFLTKIKKQEICFDRFQQSYEKLQSTISDDQEEATIICSSVLDQWALWVDQIDFGQSFESQSIKSLLDQLNKEIINKIPKDKNDLKWITPSRSIVLAKHLATKRIASVWGKIKELFNRENKEKEIFQNCANILDGLINSKDGILYPAAHYYRTFVYVKDGSFRQDKDKFIRIIRAAEKLIQQHIDMQMSYSLKISRDVSKAIMKNSFCAVDAYNKQKENMIDILSHYIKSIHTLLGSHCSVTDLQQEVGIDKKKAEDYFNLLVKTKCIVNCKVNGLETVPNRNKALKKIAKDYNINMESLETFLNGVKNPSQEEIKKDLEKTNMILCTRRKFWDYLVNHEVLYKPPSVDQLNNDVQDFPNPCLKYVLFDPTPKNINYFLQGKKPPKGVEYAIISIENLKKVKLTKFSKLITSDDLDSDISNDERTKIWSALIKNEIIKEDGSLSPHYKVGMDFNFVDRFLYEDVVMGFIEKNYVAELVRRQWLEERDPIRRIKLISYLPLDPYDNLLCDLQSAHIISGNRVTEDKSIDFVNQIKQIPIEAHEQEQLVLFLKNHQAACTLMKEPTISFDHIRDDIAKSIGYKKVITMDPELHQFSLCGFEDIIKMSENKIPWKKLLIIFVTGAIFVTSALALFSLSLSTVVSALVEIFASGLLMKGLMDFEIIIETLIRRNNLTWDDYIRRMFKEPTVFTEESRTAAVLSAYHFIKNRGEIVTINNTTNRRGTNQKTIFNMKYIMEIQHPRIGRSMALEQLIAEIHYNIEGKLGVLWRHLEQRTNNYIITIIGDFFKETKMKRALNNLCHSKDLISAEWTVENELNQIVFKFVNCFHFWIVEKLDTAFLEYQLSRTDEKQQKETSVEQDIFKTILSGLDTFNMVDKLDDISKREIETIKDKLQTIEVVERENDSDVNDEFLTTIQNLSESKLIQETQKSMGQLKKIILQKVAELLSYQRVERLQNEPKWYKENRIRNSNATINQQQSRIAQTYLKWLEKTKDPIVMNLMEGSARDDLKFTKKSVPLNYSLLAKKVATTTIAL